MDTMLLSLGINASLKKGGTQLRISMRDDVKRVCEWVKRFRYDESRYVRPDSYASPNMRPVENGWAVQVGEVERLRGGPVVAIETESQRYVANSVLTHNCLPKDTANLCAWARQRGRPATLVEAVRAYNRELRSG
jgi:hypothetical protein